MPIPPRPISRSISYWPASAFARAETSDAAIAIGKAGTGNRERGTQRLTRTSRGRKMCPRRKRREGRPLSAKRDETASARAQPCLDFPRDPSHEHQGFLEDCCMATQTLPSAETAHDAFPINGTDYVEFYVGNAKQASHFYRSAFGFQLVAYRGPETGVRDRASYLMEQGKIRLVLTTPMSPSSPIAEHVHRHGDGVKDYAL